MPQFKVKVQKSNIHRQASRSGRGVAVPALSPRKRLGALPRKPFMSGDMGSPSSSTDVTASRLMQRVMNDDDIEYYQQTHNNPPYNVQKTYRRSGGGQAMIGASVEKQDNVLREYIRSLIIEAKTEKDPKPEAEDDEEDSEKDVEEMSTASSVAGYTLPLGMSNMSKKDRKNIWKSYARAFGDAQLYSSLDY